MKNFRIFVKPVNTDWQAVTSSMNKKTRETMFALLLAAFFHGGAGGLFAQAEPEAGASGGEGIFKQLLIRKFDSSLDGSLTGLGKGKAVEFLNRQDRNKDGKISLDERSLAITELSQLPDLNRRGATETMTIENRNETKRDVAWGNFIKKLPHSKDGLTFTKMPGDPGFRSKGDDFIDPTRMKGVAPTGSRVTSEELKARFTKEKFANKLKRQRTGVKPLKKETQPTEPLGKKDYYAGTTILVVGDEHTVVPEGAVISLPANRAGLVDQKPRGTLVIWPEFIKKHARVITTKEVSWQTAKGEDLIPEKEKKALALGGKVVVAVYNQNPISVLEPKVKEQEVVGGAIASETSGKGKSQ